MIHDTYFFNVQTAMLSLMVSNDFHRVTAFQESTQLTRALQPQQKRLVPTCSQRRPRIEDVVNLHNLNELRVGGLTVPRHRWRRDLRQKGVHRSVEYVVERLMLDGADVVSTADAPLHRRADIEATMRPAGRLIPRLERDWPITITIGEGNLWSYKQDVALCAVVCATFAAAILGGIISISEFCGIYGIASDSMIPTLIRGDALLVEKVSIRAAPPRRGEVVLVRPPREVELAVRRQGGPLLGRYLLVKRVAAIGGDKVDVDYNGVRVNGAVVGGRVSQQMRSRLLSGVTRVEDGFVYMLGDNGAASVDSRFWGCIPEADVVGRPVARIFPPERFHLWGFEDLR